MNNNENIDNLQSDKDIEAYINEFRFCSCKKCGHINQVISYHNINYNCKKCGSLLENSPAYKPPINLYNIYCSINNFDINKTIRKKVLILC